MMNFRSHRSISLFVLGCLSIIGLPLLSCTSSHHFAYDEIEVEYHNAQDGVKLAGALTLPDTEKRVPAVLLIQGSGPYDRNEQIWGHRVFEVIAQHLAKRGIAVMRADKRGTGQSGGKYVFFDIENFTEDAFAGVRFLQNQERIDARHIGLIGHSLGGLIAPIMAAQSEDIAYVVLMAAPGLWGKKTFYHQNKLWAEISGVPQQISRLLQL